MMKMMHIFRRSAPPRDTILEDHVSPPTIQVGGHCTEFPGIPSTTTPPVDYRNLSAQLYVYFRVGMKGERI